MITALLCALGLCSSGVDSGSAKLGIDEIIHGIEANEKACALRGVGWSATPIRASEFARRPGRSCCTLITGSPMPVRAPGYLRVRTRPTDLVRCRRSAAARLGASGETGSTPNGTIRTPDSWTARRSRGRWPSRPSTIRALFRDFHSDTFDVPKDFFQEGSEAAFVLPLCLKVAKAEYRIRAELEEIDGSPCHVVERAGKDVIWLDAEHGYNVRRRTIYWPSGAVCAEFKASGLDEKAPGIWLPNRQISVAFNPDSAPVAYRGRVMFVLINRLEEARFGDVPDGLFEVPLPKDVRVFDLRKKE